MSETMPAEEMDGVIVQRQTTFLVIRDTANGQSFHVDYDAKREFSLHGGTFHGFRILNQHPLLDEYNQPPLAVYLAGPPSDAKRTAERIQGELQNHFDSWRGYWRHMSVDLVAFLSDGFGFLYDGPVQAATLVMNILEEEGASYSYLQSRQSLAQVKVLLLGSNYIVAQDFHVSRCP